MESTRIAGRERIIEYLKNRVRELEEELEVLRRLLELAEKGAAADALPGERLEEIKVGRKRVARLFKGDSYMRLVFEEPVPLPEEVEAYLRSVEEELREQQAKSGDVEGDALARMSLEYGPGGGVVEVRFSGLYTTIDHLKVRAALKYAAETVHVIVKARSRGEEEV